MNYGADVVVMWRRAGYFVNRILKGARPADLPVELPTTYDLIVNQTTVSGLPAPATSLTYSAIAT